MILHSLTTRLFPDIAGSALALLAFLLSARLSRQPLHPTRVRAATVLFALFTLAAVAIRVVDYALVLRHGPLNPWNQSMAAVAAAWLRGQPLYPLPADGLYYGVLYGPLLYRILAFMQDLGGIGTPLMAIPGILAEGAALALTGYAVRRSGAGRTPMLVALAALIGLLSLTYPFTGFRTDPFLLLLAALALLLAMGAPGAGRALALGLCAGLATALKPSGALYIGPALLMALPLQGPVAAGRFLLLAAVGGVLGAGLPFVGTGVTPADYLAYLAVMRPVGLHARILLGNLAVSALLLCPLWLLSPAERRKEAALILGLVLCLMMACVLGAVDGAGKWHLTPLLPYAALLLARALMGRSALSLRDGGRALAILVVMVTGTANTMREVSGIMTAAPRDQALRQSITAFLAAHPGAIVAISPTDMFLNRQASWLVGQGMPLLVSHNGWIDLGRPDAVRHFIDLYLTRCDGRYWLSVERVPFAPNRDTPPMVREAFLALYRPQALEGGLQVWSCTPDTQVPPG